MDNREEVSEYLQSRRAKVTPDQAGLPVIGARRVAGLRRSEVAALAGMSVEYYAKLERGALAGASAGVLESAGPAFVRNLLVLGRGVSHMHDIELVFAAQFGALLLHGSLSLRTSQDLNYLRLVSAPMASEPFSACPS